MSPQNKTSLSMSQTKDELLRHLNMSPEIYDLMAAETAELYSWLTSHEQHFKTNSNRVAPFDWSDITEVAKERAAALLSTPTDKVTSAYWKMGESPHGDNNWIAIWFLYHKFRYRDGRNRSKESKKGAKRHRKSGSDEYSQQPIYYEYPIAPAPPTMAVYVQTMAQNVRYPASPAFSTPLFDPVRDIWVSPQ